MVMAGFVAEALIEEADEKTIIIRELPYNITTQGLIDSVEKASKAGKLKISSINDYTAEIVEVEIKLSRGVYAEETIDALYAFTDCEVSVSPNLVLIKENMPCQMSVEDVLRHNTDKLVNDLEKELKIDLGRLKEKLHARKLEQIFIEERLYKEIEEIKTSNKIISTVENSLKIFADELVREVSIEDIERLLEIRIKRISRFDIDRQKKDIRAIERDIKKVEKSLKDMIGFTVNHLEQLLNKYGELFPRKSKIKHFDQVDVRAAAFSNLHVGYNRESGYLGHKVKAEDKKKDLEISCSELDRLLLIFSNGLYKVINVTEKFFIGENLLWMDVVRNDVVFNIVYRNGSANRSYVKRFRTPKFILNRDYHLFPEHKRSVIQFMETGDKEVRARASLAPSGRAKFNSIELEMDDYLIKAASAIGKRVSNRVVRRVSSQTGKPRQEKETPPVLPGFNATEEKGGSQSTD